LEANTQAEISMINALSQANITLIQAESIAESLEIVVQSLNVTGNLTEDHVLHYLYLQTLPVLAEYGNVIIVMDGNTAYVIDVEEG
jgi:hypothetical protein